MGEGEKLVRKLFSIASERAPSVIFFDEIDSLLGKRGDGEHEAARRLKTEFLVQVDGVGSSTEQILVLAATNRPFDLDSAALRRLLIKILIGLPDLEARKAMIARQISDVTTSVKDSDSELTEVAGLTENYSASDLKAVVYTAVMRPLKELPPEQLLEVKKEEL